MLNEQQNHLERMRSGYESKLADQRAKIERDLGVRMRGEVEKARSGLNKEQQDLRLVNLTMDQCCLLLIHYNLTVDQCCLLLIHNNLTMDRCCLILNHCNLTMDQCCLLLVYLALSCL